MRNPADLSDTELVCFGCRLLAASLFVAAIGGAVATWMLTLLY